MTTLEDLYHKAWRRPSPINEHTPTLRILASDCESVTEFGTEQAVSTTAFLAAQPLRLTTIDKINPTAQVQELVPLAGRTTFEIVKGDTIDITIQPTDLLLIDTRHTSRQLYAELTRHAEQVRRWIVLHDTVTYGPSGEDQERGLSHGLNLFLSEHPDWVICAEYTNNNGLTILKRKIS